MRGCNLQLHRIALVNKGYTIINWNEKKVSQLDSAYNYYQIGLSRNLPLPSLEMIGQLGNLLNKASASLITLYVTTTKAEMMSWSMSWCNKLEQISINFPACWCSEQIFIKSAEKCDSALWKMVSWSTNVHRYGPLIYLTTKWLARDLFWAPMSQCVCSYLVPGVPSWRSWAVLQLHNVVLSLSADIKKREEKCVETSVWVQ